MIPGDLNIPSPFSFPRLLWSWRRQLCPCLCVHRGPPWGSCPQEVTENRTSWTPRLLHEHHRYRFVRVTDQFPWGCVHDLLSHLFSYPLPPLSLVLSSLLGKFLLSFPCFLQLCILENFSFPSFLVWKATGSFFPLWSSLRFLCESLKPSTALA